MSSNNSKNAKLQYEAGQAAAAMAAMTDSGDATTFESAATMWSGKSGYDAVVRPNGRLTGGAVTPSAAGGNNNVDVAALTCNLAGVETSVSAALNTAITRPATAVSKINSITVNSSGAIAVVAGTDGATTAFSVTRAAAGGPPLIPVGSIEIAQVRVTSNTAAPITAAQIFAVVGLHTEDANFPVWNIDYATGSITFLAALPKIHTGTLPKAVYASYSEPIFGDVQLANDFKPPEISHSATSEQIFGTTLGSSSETLGQGSFVAYLDDGITDPLVAQKNQKIWFRFYPDRTKTPHLLMQGTLGIGRTYKAGDRNQAACTISAESTAIEVA